jgi:hypothetical protein
MVTKHCARPTPRKRAPKPKRAPPKPKPVAAPKAKTAGKNLPKSPPTRRYDPQRIDRIVPASRREKGPSKPWRSFNVADKCRMVWEIRIFADQHKKQLKYKAPTGSEYAKLALLLFSAEIGEVRARQLFAAKADIVQSWRQCLNGVHSRRTIQYLHRCALAGVAPGYLHGVDNWRDL